MSLWAPKTRKGDELYVKKTCSFAIDCCKVIKAWHAEDGSLNYSIFFEDGYPLEKMTGDELEQGFFIFSMLPTENVSD